MTASRIDDAAFLGKLTAGATHEIRNMLSVIKESAGLIEDLLDAGVEAPSAHADKFRKMVANILAQVERGSTLLKSLNTIAHATDERMKAVEVKQALECQSVLYARFCRLKGVTLSAPQTAVNPSVITDPVMLHYAVCSLIDLLLEQAPAQSDISMTCERDGDRLAIQVGITDFTQSSPEGVDGEAMEQKLSVAQNIADSLGGSLELRSSEGIARLTLPLVGRSSAAM